MKKLVLLVFLSVFSFIIFAEESSSGQSMASETEARERNEPKQKENSEEKMTFEWIRHHHFPFLTIGPGINAVAINLGSRKVDVLNSLSAVEFTVNWHQFGFIHWRTDEVDENWTSEIYRFALGSSLGFIGSFSGNADKNDVRLGINISPLVLRSGNFTLGFGFRYLTDENLTFNMANVDHWSFTLPISYQFTRGGSK